MNWSSIAVALLIGSIVAGAVIELWLYRLAWWDRGG